MTHRWNGKADEHRPMTDARPTLTRRGWVAAIVATAEPYDWTRRAGDEPNQEGTP